MCEPYILDYRHNIDRQMAVFACIQQYEKGHCHTQSCHFVDLGQEQRFFLENIRILPVFINLFIGTLCQDTA